MRQNYEKNTSKWTVIECMDIFIHIRVKPILYEKKKVNILKTIFMYLYYVYLQYTIKAKKYTCMGLFK